MCQVSHVTCHVSCITCHMSHVLFHMWINIFSDKLFCYLFECLLLMELPCLFFLMQPYKQVDFWEQYILFAQICIPLLTDWLALSSLQGHQDMKGWMDSVQCIVHCLVYFNVLCSGQCILNCVYYCVLYLLYSLQCTFYSEQCTVYSEQLNCYSLHWHFKQAQPTMCHSPKVDLTELKTNF